MGASKYYPKDHQRNPLNQNQRCLVIFNLPHRPWCVSHWAGCFEDPPCAQSWRLCKGGSSSSPHWAAEIPGKTSTSPPMPPISDAEHRWISEPNRRPELVVPSPSSHPIDVEWWVKCRYWPSIFWSAHTVNQAQTMNLWFYMVVYTQSARFHSTVYWLWDQTTWFGLVHKQIGQWLRLCPSNFGPHQLLLWRWCRLVWGTGTSTPYAIRARWRFWKRTNPGGRLSFSSSHFQPSVFHWWFQDVSGCFRMFQVHLQWWLPCFSPSFQAWPACCHPAGQRSPTASLSRPGMTHREKSETLHCRRQYWDTGKRSRTFVEVDSTSRGRLLLFQKNTSLPQSNLLHVIPRLTGLRFMQILGKWLIHIDPFLIFKCKVAMLTIVNHC